MVDEKVNLVNKEMSDLVLVKPKCYRVERVLVNQTLCASNHVKAFVVYTPNEEQRLQILQVAT